MKALVPLYLLLCTAVFAEPFTFGGEEYETTLPAMDFSLPAWKQGEQEPPILPNQAYVAAKKAFDAQFGHQMKAYAHFVVLRQWNGGGADHDKVFTAYEIVFLEQPTAEQKNEPWRKKPTGPGAWSTYVANMHYYVLMDGSVVSPKKVAPPHK